MSGLHVEAKHLALVKALLAGVSLPVFAFGSRVSGKHKEFSDLDLLIKGAISKQELAQLKYAFEESALPFKVDIVVWEDLDENFRQQIAKDLLLSTDW